MLPSQGKHDACLPQLWGTFITLFNCGCLKAFSAALSCHILSVIQNLQVLPATVNLFFILGHGDLILSMFNFFTTCIYILLM